MILIVVVILIRSQCYPPCYVAFRYIIAIVINIIAIIIINTITDTNIVPIIILKIVAIITISIPL